jgi:serine/threonine protein kinase
VAKVGDNFGGWTLRRFIGDGGQGEVFAATKLEGGEEVAVKIVKATKPKKRSRFLQEVGIHAALSSQRAPNIIPVIQHNLEELEDGGVHGFIVMPLAVGTLADYREVLVGRVELCLEVFAGILRGVVAAHAASVVHRDLKPSNVLFLDRSLRTPFVADFGICLLKTVATQDRVTEVGETVGAKFFMAPEQERGGVADILPSADNYALAKLLHNMLTGRYLYREEVDKAFTERELHADVRYQQILDRILSKTLVQDPAARIQSATELLEIVESIRRTDGSGDGSGGEEPEAPPSSSNDESSTTRSGEPNLESSAYRQFVTQLVKGNARALGLEFEGFRREFSDAWATIHKRIEKNPRAGRDAAVELIEAQPKTTAAVLAIARTDTERLFNDYRKLIEFILRSSEGKSGYPAVFTVPHVQAGYYYMAMATFALHFESWDVLHRLLNDKFEWYYQSGRALFTRGYALSYFFHVDALGRGASVAHDLYRAQLSKDPVAAEVGLTETSLLDAYLQAQFVISLRGSQSLEKGEDIPLWADYGRFHGYRVEPVLDRIYHNDQYASGILRAFGETRLQFLEKLNSRLKLLSGRMKGGNFFWDSIESWEPRTSPRG